MNTLTKIAAPVLAVCLLANTAQSKPHLRDVEVIREGLIATAIAYEIGQVCDGISARIVRGISFLNSLKAQAKAMGYTDAEIDDFVNSKAEQDRMEGMARARLRSKGAIPGDPASHCTVGRSEISAGSQIGMLLRG